jgi:uncharacterized 2Fe-2S/4Fe-4S cluster protein (DUF4445 family)
LDRESLKNVIPKGRHHLSEDEEEQGYVLSCETQVFGNINVYSIQNNKNNTLKILSEGQSFDVSIEPLIKKEYFQKENCTRVFAEEKELGIEAGDTREKSYGVVVDIGTTTLVAAIVNLNDGSQLGTVSSLNPQAVYAQDVLSRIKFSSDDNGLSTMYTEVIKEINRMIHEVSDNCGISTENIYEVIIQRQYMHDSFSFKHQSGVVRKVSIYAKVNGAVYLNASEHKIDISKFGIIYLPPLYRHMLVRISLQEFLHPGSMKRRALHYLWT